MRILGPRRSEVNEEEEASRKVYSPGMGTPLGSNTGVASFGCGVSSTTVAEDDSDIKMVGSVLRSFDGT